VVGVIWPAAIVTLAGVTVAEELLLVRVTVTPPVGAAVCSEIPREAVLPKATVMLDGNKIRGNCATVTFAVAIGMPVALP
jgi:hypothetical protein